MRYRNMEQYSIKRKDLAEKERIMRLSAKMPHLDETMLGIFSYFLSPIYQKASLSEIKSFGEKMGLEEIESYKALANLEIEGMVEGERRGNETPEKFNLTELGRKIRNNLEKGLLDAERNKIYQSTENQYIKQPKKVINL